MKTLLRNLINGEFVRNVSVLAGGTAIAGALGVLVLPLLTRIYSPEEFSVLGVFAALLGMVSVNACLRYEIAIPLPESDQSAANLLAVALACVAGVTTVVTMAIFFFGSQITALVNMPLLAQYLWLLPIGVAVSGAYSVFQYWATRKKAFARIARTRVERSFGGVSTQLIMGWSGTGTLGLIVGQIVSNGAGFLGLARRAFSEDCAVFKRVSVAEMKRLAREYDRQPKYSTLEALTNNAGIQIPIIFISSLTAGSEVGYLMLAMQIMQAPMSLIGSSISQVYLPRAVEEHRNGRLGDFTARTIGGLVKIGVGPLIFVGIIAPSVFGLVFGAEWERAGELVVWMTPWFVLQFLVSPVSMALSVTNNQRTAMVLQVAGLLLRVLTVLVAGTMLSARYVPEAFAISGFLFYLIYFLVVCRIANVTFAQNAGLFKGIIPSLLTLVLIAFIVRAIFP